MKKLRSEIRKAINQQGKYIALNVWPIEADDEYGGTVTLRIEVTAKRRERKTKVVK